MTVQKLPPLFLVLTLVAHGGAARQQQQYGGSLDSRFLNVTGRWASAGTEAAPLLTWPDMQTAVEAATTSTAARRREVGVTSVGGSRFGALTQYGHQHAGALVGYLPFGAAAARSLENERRKIMGYAKVMLAPDSAPQGAEPVSVMKEAARSLRLAGVGNGSWFTAAQGLTGKRALDIYHRVLEGELQCDPGMTPADFGRAIALAVALASAV